MMPAGSPPPLSVVVVISRYPPHHAGGYELRCRDVCTELARRGHSVTVLTSSEGAAGVSGSGGVRIVRALHLWPRGVQGHRAAVRFAFDTAADCRRLRRELRRARADVVTYWHQSGLSSGLLAVRPPRRCGILCDVSSDWLLDAAETGGNWFRILERPAGTWTRRVVKALLRTAAALRGAPVRRPAFPPGPCYFTSAETRRRYVEDGVDVGGAAVIRSGIELDRFTQGPAERGANGVRLLFLGRIKRRKGLHTAAVALSYLPARFRLDVVGEVEDDAYAVEVAEIVRAARCADRVRIAPPVPHEDVPALLRSADALVFPSEEPEAFSRLVLEAFASGTPVVGTTIGGTGEVLIEGETGLTYPPGNARALADQIARLFSDDALRGRLVANARTLVETKYSLSWTVDQIEALLRDAHARAAAPAG